MAELRGDASGNDILRPSLHEIVTISGQGVSSKTLCPRIFAVIRLGWSLEAGSGFRNGPQ
jgi:hypothetical protein